MPISAFLPLSKQTSATITGYGLYDYLQADNRPTFLICLSMPDDLGEDNNAFLAFYNTTLSNDNVLLGKVTRVLARLPSRNEHDHDATNFLSWIWGDTQSSIWFGDTLWSATGINAEWRVVSGVRLPDEMTSLEPTTNHIHRRKSSAGTRTIGAYDVCHQPIWPAGDNPKAQNTGTTGLESYHSERLLSSVSEPTAYQKRMQSFDWSNTALGPIATWPQNLYQVVKQALASPIAIFVFWGPSRILLCNDAAAKSIPGLDEIVLGLTASDVFKTFWKEHYERLCQEVERTGCALNVAKSPGLLVSPAGDLRETFWSYTYVPLFDDNGDVCGIYAQSYDKTSEVLLRDRNNILTRVNEAVNATSDLRNFWPVLFAELEKHAVDVPLAAVYSIGNRAMLDFLSDFEVRQNSQIATSIDFQNSIDQARCWTLEGKMGFPEEHASLPSKMAFDSTHGLSVAFRQAMAAPTEGDVLLCVESGTLPVEFLVRGVDDGTISQGIQVVACPLHRPSGGVIAWLVVGINPKRAFDNDYKHFIRSLSKSIENKLNFILTLEGRKEAIMHNPEMVAYQQQQPSSPSQQQECHMEEYRSLFFNFAKQVPFGVFVLGNDGEVQFCNDAWNKMLKITPESAAAKPWHGRVHPEDVEKVEHQWLRMNECRSHERFEWRVLRPGSTSFDSEDDMIYLESCGFADMADDGTMKSTIGITIDVTIQKAYQREQAEKLNNAVKAKRTQEHFMDMVSHEMRNPLSAIIQCAEETSHLLQRLKENVSVKNDASVMLDDVNDIINTILYCASHQKKIIDDVLTLSKLDSNLLVLHPTEVCLSALLEKAIKVFDTEIRTSKVEVFTSLKDFVDVKEEPSPIVVDPSRVVQILINLISNAIRSMKRQQTRELHITVHISRESRSIESFHQIPSGHDHTDPTLGSEWGTGEPIYVYFTVRDTGLGLSESEMNSLFTRFQQASPRTHVTYSGSGLGLFISRELTELHGGKMGISPHVDQGSTFIFYVKGRRHNSESQTSKTTQPPRPVLENNRDSSTDRRIPVMTPPPISSPSPHPETSPTLHILVVEDNEINRRVLKRQLKKLGYQVTTANHGQEALSILQTSTWWQGEQPQKDLPFSESNDSRPKFSVILCDLEMPVMDGLTCVRQIRQWQQQGLLHSNIPVLAVTGNARAELTLSDAGSDFDDVVAKPYTLTNLVQRMLSRVNPEVAVVT